MATKAACPCVVMAFCRAIPLILFLLPLGCGESIQPKSGNESSAVVTGGEISGLVQPEHYPLLLNRLKKLAGDGALDCGMVGNFETPDGASNCALKAREGKRPFFVRYSVQGIDTEQVLGFAGAADGAVFSVWYFGEGYTTGVKLSQKERARNMKLTDDGRISIEECSKPVNFRKANDGRVTCFLRDP